MIQLNLLPDLKKEYIKSQKTKGLVISVSILVTLAAVGLSVLLFIYVAFLQQVQINLATDDIKQKEGQLKAIPNVDKYLTIQAQLSALPNLHAQKGAYDRLFDFLNVLNPSAPNNITLNTLQLSGADKGIVLTGSTSSFEALNIFADTLKNAQITYKAKGQGDPVTEGMFTQVLVQSSGFSRSNNKDLVSFTIKVTYRDSVFDIQNTDTKATVPSITTTQSVTQSPQAKQLFNADSKGQQ
jgi:hypothetical protein